MVVAQVLRAQEVRTVCEDDVVLDEAFFDDGGRGDDNNWASLRRRANMGPLFRKSL